MCPYSAMQKYLYNPRVGACSLSTDWANISIRRLAADGFREAKSIWHGVTEPQHKFPSEIKLP